MKMRATSPTFLRLPPSPRQSRRSWIALPLLLALGGLSLGCKPKADKPQPTAPAGVKQNGESSVYRQAIDRAKALEKQINDRAIDPGEKARLGGPDPSGQDQ